MAAAAAAAQKTQGHQNVRTSELKTQIAVLETKLANYVKEVEALKNELNEQQRVSLKLIGLLTSQPKPSLIASHHDEHTQKHQTNSLNTNSSTAQDLITFDEIDETNISKSTLASSTPHEHEPLVFIDSDQRNSLDESTLNSSPTVTPRSSSPSSDTSLENCDDATAFDPSSACVLTAPIKHSWPAPAPKSNKTDHIWSASQRRNTYFQPDRDTAFGTHQADYWRYGLCYYPSPVTQSTRLRVVVSNLPRSTTLAHLFSKIRGGSIVSCDLLDTTSITGSASALVRFKYESAARSYAGFARIHPLVFSGQIATVTLLSSPTYPLSANKDANVYGRGRTRCLLVRNWPQGIALEAICRDVSFSRELEFVRIEHVGQTAEGDLEMRFASIWDAGSAFGALTNFRAYRGCKVSFVEDPCAGPLGGLLDPAMDERDALLSDRAASGKDIETESIPKAETAATPELDQKALIPDLEAAKPTAHCQDTSGQSLSQEHHQVPRQGDLNGLSLKKWIEERRTLSTSLVTESEIVGEKDRGTDSRQSTTKHPDLRHSEELGKHGTVDLCTTDGLFRPCSQMSADQLVAYIELKQKALLGGLSGGFSGDMSASRWAARRA